jgi:acetylornithine deacetylase/succinyl-diaminopimelate desuccinylase-like protein
MAEALANWFTQFGGEVELEIVEPDRPNVYARWQGESDQWAVVDVHTDTVGVEQMTDPPFDGRIEEGRVYGRGAVDTKATLGILLALLEGLHQAGRKPAMNLLIAATVNEEAGFTGARAFADWVHRQNLQFDQLVVAEPTLCAPVYGHKGGASVVFEIQGIPAHTSQPHLGQNAINAAAQLVLAMEQEHQRLQTLTAQTPVGLPTITVSLIEGGTGGNVVPDRCRVTVGRRNVPGEDPDQVLTDLIALGQASCPLPVEIKASRSVGGFLQSPDTPWITDLAQWAGQPATVTPYGTHALVYGGLSKEMVVFGPGSIDQAHGQTEWVEISELSKAAQIYQQWLGI